MHGLDNLIIDLTIILAGAGIVTVLFKKLKQPVVLGYIVVGILISPNFKYLPSLINSDDISVWANIGIVFLMFALGLEFSFHKIVKVGKSAIITAGVVMAAMMVAGFGIGSAMGWKTMDCIFLGGMVSMSSTMIILKSYDELKLKEKRFAQIVLGALVIEDIIGIFMMIVLTTISVSRNISGGDLVKQIVVLLLALVVMLCVGIYLIPTILNKIKGLINDEILLIFSLGLCMVMVVISTEIGFSEALGAFLAGSILAGTSFSERIEIMVKPIKDLFGAIFFVSVGMMVNPSMLIQYLMPIVIITLATILGQMIFSAVGAMISGQSLEISIRVGFSMVQVGEFSFILAALGSSLGVMSDFVYQIIVFVSVFTIFLTPVFIKVGEKAAFKIPKLIPEKLKLGIENRSRKKEENGRLDGDWKSYLKKYVIRTIVCTAILFVIIVLGINFLLPYLSELMGNVGANIIIMIVMFCCMSPFINIICRRKSVFFNKLWVKSASNRLPLIITRGISIFISVMAIEAAIKRTMFNLPIWIEFFAALLVVFIAAKSDFMRGKAINVETRFITNFNDKLLKMKSMETEKRNGLARIMDEVFAIDFEAKNLETRSKISDFIARKTFGIIIVQIRRNNGDYVNVIKADTPIYEGDIITAVGSEENIEAYLMMLEQKDCQIIKNGKIESLTEHIYTQIFNKVEQEDQLVCMEIPVTKKMSFYRKPIKNTNFREKYKGSILGIERNHLLILNPNPYFIINDEDVVWALGTQVMVDEVMKLGKEILG